MFQLIDFGFITGIGMLAVLAGATLLVLRKIRAEKQVIILFFGVLILHAFAASFIYFTDFQPFSGGQGDYDSYHKTAEHISYRFWDGNFFTTPQERGAAHYFAVVIAVIYTLLFPSMIIGQLFNVWLAALAMLFLYFIVKEIDGSPPWALTVGLIGGLYPSFLFYSSLLLKDVVVILFVFMGLLLALRMLRHFTWQSFALLYIVLLVLTNFRFYIGVILVGTFTVSWLLFSRLEWKKRLLYAVVMLPLLGFIPQLASKAGYFGVGSFLEYGNEDLVSFYKEEVYNPPIAVEQSGALPSQIEERQPTPTVQQPEEIPSHIEERQPMPETLSQASEPARQSEELPQAGYSSSVDLHISFESPVAFVSSFFQSFLFVVIGPYPFQFTALRHYLVLLEMLPWYVLLFFIIRGVFQSFKRDRRVFLLLLFSFGLLSLLALFFSNFGITTRIRISAFLALLPFIPFGFEQFQPKLFVLVRENQKIQRIWHRINYVFFRIYTRWMLGLIAVAKKKA